MANLIDKEFIKNVVQFTDNIVDRMVDNHITNVQYLEVQPLIDTVMWDNIQEILSNPSHSFPELETFFETYIKGWVAFLTAYQIYVWHGNNITQYGIRVMNEDTSVAIAPQDRAVLLQSIKNNAIAAYNRMRKALSDANNTFDGLTYNDVANKNRGNKLQIRRVGGINLNDRFHDNQNLDNLCPRQDC